MVGLLCGALAAVASARVRTVTRADAESVASEIALRHSDLPTFEQTPAHPFTAQRRALSAKESACAGTAPLSTAYALVLSPGFVSGATIAESATVVFPSSAWEAQDLAANAGPRVVQCALAYEKASLSNPPKGQSVSAIRVVQLSAKAPVVYAIRATYVVSARPGAEAAALRSARDVRVAVYVDGLTIPYGQADVGLTVTTFGAAPTPAFEQHLADVLYARAKATLGS
jgi:hypothetical protein